MTNALLLYLLARKYALYLEWTMLNGLLLDSPYG